MPRAYAAPSAVSVTVYGEPASQFVGAFIGATLVWLSYLPHWGATEDPGLKLAAYSTAPAIRNTPANLICEIIGTFVLVFGVLAIVGRDRSVALEHPPLHLNPKKINFARTDLDRITLFFISEPDGVFARLELDRLADHRRARGHRLRGQAPQPAGPGGAAVDGATMRD